MYTLIILPNITIIVITMLHHLPLTNTESINNIRAKLESVQVIKAITLT